MKSEVIVNGVAVDLSEDFSITIEKNSRIMQFDTIVDTWAYNLSFPRTETNEAIFEYAERFEKNWHGWKEFSFKYFYNGRLLLNGKIKIKYRQRRYEGYAFGSFGSIASSQLSKNLQLLKFPLLTFENKALYSGDDPYCVFPMQNPYFYWERGKEIEVKNTAGETVKRSELYYRWMQEQYGIVNRYDTQQNKFIVPNGFVNALAVVSPYFFTWYIIERIFANYSVNVTENILKTDDELKKACIFSSYDISGIDFTTTLLKDFEQLDFGNDIYIDQYILSKMFIKSVSDFKATDLLPDDWTVKDFILGIQNFLNVLLDFSDNSNEVKIVDREGIFSKPAIDLEAKLIALPELDPEISKRIVLKFGIDQNDFFWRDNYTELTDEQWERYKGEIANYAALEALTEKELGDVYYCTEELQYREYSLRSTDIGNGEIEEQLIWMPISRYGQPITFGDSDASELVIESKFGVVAKVPGSLGSKGYMLLIGNSKKYYDDPRPFLPRIMFYKGLVNGEPNGTPLTGNLHEMWQGEKGLYEKRWKNTIKALKDGVPGVAYFDFNEVDFQNLNLNQKFRIDEGEFLIVKTTTTFNLDSVGQTEAHIVKLT